jgi:hypothetical protein
VKELQTQGAAKMIIALVGNKSDLEDGRRIRTDEARAYAEENGVLFMETSAKTAQNVSEIFEAIGTSTSLRSPLSPLMAHLTPCLSRSQHVAQEASQGARSSRTHSPSLSLPFSLCLFYSRHVEMCQAADTASPLAYNRTADSW